MENIDRNVINRMIEDYIYRYPEQILQLLHREGFLKESNLSPVLHSHHKEISDTIYSWGFTRRDDVSRIASEQIALENPYKKGSSIKLEKAEERGEYVFTDQEYYKFQDVSQSRYHHIRC